MSGDEMLVTVLAMVLGPVAWIYWLFQLYRIRRGRRPSPLHVVTTSLVLCAGLIFIVLDTVASFDVVDDPRYQFLYLVLGLAWLRVAAWGFAFVGLSARDDVAERANAASTFALSGALLGTTLCYAGGNIGSGPGWWVVVFSAGLATATLMAAWLVLATVTPVADAIAIDRDLAAGLRLGTFLMALGVLLGRAVAGDWSSAIETLIDFARIVPVAGTLLGIAVLVERALRLTPDRPSGPLLSQGLLPSLLYLAVAIVGVRWMGPIA